MVEYKNSFQKDKSVSLRLDIQHYPSDNSFSLRFSLLLINTYFK